MKPCGACRPCMDKGRPWVECDRVVGARFKASLADLLALLSDPSTPMRPMPWRGRWGWRVPT